MEPKVLSETPREHLDQFRLALSSLALVELEMPIGLALCSLVLHAASSSSDLKAPSEPAGVCGWHWPTDHRPRVGWVLLRNEIAIPAYGEMLADVTLFLVVIHCLYCPVSKLLVQYGRCGK